MGHCGDAYVPKGNRMRAFSAVLFWRSFWREAPQERAVDPVCRDGGDTRPVPACLPVPRNNMLFPHRRGRRIPANRSWRIAYGT